MYKSELKKNNDKMAKMMKTYIKTFIWNIRYQAKELTLRSSLIIQKITLIGTDVDDWSFVSLLKNGILKNI